HLLDLCLDVERGLKRIRAQRWGPRIIDIDILLFGNERIEEAGLQVPHPRMGERAFVLAPLAEIAPEVVVDGQTATQRLGGLETGDIVRLPGGGDWWKE